VYPQVGKSPLRQFAIADYLLPHVIVERSGRRIGIVGIVTAQETKSASNPLESTQFLDEAASAQAQIDRLRAQGVDIIVLLTHIGYAMDIQLAGRLSGVDVIVGGHSHSPLGEGLRPLGIASDGPYPTVGRDRDGATVCIVQAWQYGWAIGQLDVSFDADGRVRDCAGQAHLIVGDDYRKNGQPVDAATRARLAAAVAQTPELRSFAPDPVAAQVLAYYAAAKQAQARHVLAHAENGLCLRRMPGPYDRGRDGRPGCAAATDAQGGEVQALVASASLHAASRFGGADIALQNGGGVRSSIAAGPFTVGDAINVLPFRNTLVILDMSGAEIVEVLNGTADYIAQAPETRTGAYPYAAGLRWRFDLGAAPGQRVQRIELWRDGKAEALRPEARYRVILSDYIAKGRDGYQMLAGIDPARRMDTALDMAQALSDYVASTGAVTVPEPADRSTQEFASE
jgi:5'-nucleotidase